MTEKCLACDTPVTEGQQWKPMKYVTMTSVEDRKVHVECGLREVMGGIGHLTNHAYWCKEMHDPDGGLSYRASALAVWGWIKDNGFDAAAAISSD